MVSREIEWLAIDRDGYVGYFNSDRAAPIPGSFDRDELFHCVKQLHPNYSYRSGHLLPIQDMFDFCLGSRKEGKIFGKPREHTVNFLDWLHPLQIAQTIDLHEMWKNQAGSKSVLLIIVESMDPIETIFGRQSITRFAQRPSGPPFVLTVNSMSGKQAERLYTSNVCLHIQLAPHSKGLLRPDKKDNNVFNYSEFDFFSKFSALKISVWPYACDYPPTTPINVDQLDKKLQNVLRKTTFDEVSFFECPMIQPLDFVDSTTMSGNLDFVSSEGLTIGNPLWSEDQRIERQSEWDVFLQESTIARAKRLRSNAILSPDG